MTAIVLPRELGVRLRCDGTGCGASVATAMCGRKENRAWWATLGWGRGSDPGVPYRAAEPARETVRDRFGQIIERARPARKEHPGRERTTSHDLCPPCLAKDRAAAAERAARRAKQIVARDATRKERDEQLRGAA